MRSEPTYITNPPATSASRSPQNPGIEVRSRIEAIAGHVRAGLTAALAGITMTARQAPGISTQERVSGSMRATATPGASVGTVAQGVVSAPATASVAVEPSPVAGTSLAPTNPAPSVSTLNSGALAKPASNAGVHASGRSTGSSKPPQTPGFDITRTSVVLVHTSGATSVTESGTGDWLNETNALGAVNGTIATIAGQTGQTKSRYMYLSYADFANKSALTIRKVELRFYVRQQGAGLNTGHLELLWRKNGGAMTSLETITGDVNGLTTPRTFDITSGVSSWSDLDGLESIVQFESGPTELHSASVDAVLLYVEADSVIDT